MKSGLSRAQLGHDVVEIPVMQQPQADGPANLCQQREALTSFQQPELGVDDQTLVGDRFQTRGHLAGEALGLLEVCRSAAQDEANDENLGSDDAWE